MEPDWSQFIQGGPLQEQQGQIDQQLADLIARRRAYQPQQHTTGIGTLLGGIGDIIRRGTFDTQEAGLRAERQGLSDKLVSGRGAFGKAWGDATAPVTAPSGLSPGAQFQTPFTSAPDTMLAPMQDRAQAEQGQQRDLSQLRTMGMLSGDPAISGYVQHEPQMAMQQEQLAKAQEERTANASPEAGAATRSLLGKYGVNVGESTPNATLRALLPTAEKGFAASESANARRDVAKLMAGSKTAKANVDTDKAEAIADEIVAGRQSPELTGMYKLGPDIRKALAARGYDHAAALTEWRATQKHLSALNGTQQERLRQAVDFTAHSLDTIEGLYQDWKQVGMATGLKAFNKVTLAAAKQLPGDAGAAAQALEAQINDLTAELGNVYMGGNSPTDHAMKLAASNLSANWNEETLMRAVKLIRTNLTLRKNAMLTSKTAGGSRYDTGGQGAPPAPAPAQTKRKVYDPATGTIKEAP